MAGCPECSRIIIPKPLPEYLAVPTYDEPKRLRTWSSGPELIKLADAGCDLCCFIRRQLEKVSDANARRLYDEDAVVLSDCRNEITLDRLRDVQLEIEEPYYQHVFKMVPGPIGAQSSNSWSFLQPPRACEFLEFCLLGEDSGHSVCTPDKKDLSTKVESLPRRLLDISDHENILTLDVQT